MTTGQKRRLIHESATGGPIYSYVATGGSSRQRGLPPFFVSAGDAMDAAAGPCHETRAHRAVRMVRQYVDEWWKYTATGACAVLVTVALGYATGAADWVTRDQVSQLIHEQSPYIKDRDRLTAELSFIKQTLLELRVDQRDTINELREDNRRLREQVQSLEVKLGQITGKP